MENAAKALIIAGGVFLAIMVLTIGVYLISNLSVVSDSYVTDLDSVELQKFNSDFEVFVGRNNITAQEIVTIISLVQQKEQEIIITINGNGSCTTWSESEKNEFLQNNVEKSKEKGEIIQYSYVENSIIYGSDGKVIQIGFRENS